MKRLTVNDVHVMAGDIIETTNKLCREVIAVHLRDDRAPLALVRDETSDHYPRRKVISLPPEVTVWRRQVHGSDVRT